MRQAVAQTATVLLVLAAGMARAGEPAPLALDPKQAQTGHIVYRQYCASCHGVRGEGEPRWEELNAQGELPSPPHDAQGHTWKHSDGMLFRMVSEGWRDPFNKTQRLTMPPFRDALSPEQIRDVITYLKTLWTPEQRQFQWEETLVRGAFPPQARAGSPPPSKAQ